MVEQNRSGAYTQIVYGPTGGKLALMNGSALQKAFIGLPGQAMAVYTSSGLNHYRHADWLGSARLTSSPTQTVLSTTAYAPFGEPYAVAGTADPSFTGQNQDTSTGIYDFPAREYSMQGRWPSPDPSGLAAVNPAAPQSWNRYAYVLGNPLASTDPSGLDCVYTNDDGSVKRVQEGDCDSEDDDGYYVDGTIVGGASGVTFDSVSGSYSFMLTDDQGYTFQSGIDTASPSATFYGEGSGLGPDDPTTTAVNALAQTTPLLMAFDYNSLNEDREDYYGLKLVGRVGWQVAKLNPNVLLLSCDGVNFVNNHQLSVQVPASTAATTFAAASYAGLEWGEWLVPEVSIPLAAYTDIYVPVAANTFCKSR